MTVRPPVAEMLISATQLRLRIGELAAEISEQHADVTDPVLLVCVLKGSTMFLADLARALEIDAEVNFMAISSYGSDNSTGVVRIVKDTDTSVVGRHTIIVEDIVDTGLTLNYLRRTLEGRAPASLSAVTLLDKRARRILPVPLERVGFEIPDVFVVGYGLDFQGLYRNLPDIYAVRDVARLAADPRVLLEPLFGPRSQGRNVSLTP